MSSKKKKIVSTKKTTIGGSSRVHSVTAVLAFVLVVVLLSSLITLLLFKWFHQPSPVETEKLPYDFTVVKDVSFILDSDALHFGGGPQGARLERGLNLSVSKDFLVKISWEGPGDLLVSKNDFILPANTTQYLQFYLTIPENLTRGNYSGNITFSFYDRD